MRPARLVASAVMAAALTLTGLSPASADNILTPLENPVIALLPPRPAPHVPYTGDVCADGSASCIDATIQDMQQRLDAFAAQCDNDSIFSLAYLRVTENVRDAIATGVFKDRVWLRQLDAVFAEYYFHTMDAWNSGDPARQATVPEAWRIALKAADDKSMTGLGDFLLNMNAHINRDFSYALAEAGLTGPDGASHKVDHNAYNGRLDSLYVPVFNEEAARFDPHFTDIDVGPVDETAAGLIMRGWREIVWRNAEKLVLAKTPAQRARAEKTIENYATAQARVIRRIFIAGPVMKQTRAEWCATHHG
jgi:hypothetical protein